MNWRGVSVTATMIRVLVGLCAVLLTPGRAAAQYAAEPVALPGDSVPSYVDPHLVAGATLAGLGTTSMVASAILLGTDDQMLCAIQDDCTKRTDRVGLGLGLFAGGATAAVIGTGLMLGARESDDGGYVQRDGMLVTGAVLTGLCAAGLVGGVISMVYGMSPFLSDDGGDAVLGGLAAAPVSGAICGLGIPMWLAGVRPDDNAAREIQRRASKAKVAEWPVRSRSQLGLGAAMIVTGSLTLIGGTAYIATVGGRKDDESASCCLGMLSPLVFAAPSGILIAGGAVLARRGSRRVPAGWTVSAIPRVRPTAGGMMLDWRF